MAEGLARIPVAVEPAYGVVVGARLDLGATVREAVPPGPCVLVTDSNVGPLHGRSVRERLEAAGFEVLETVEVPAGEASKSLAEHERLVRRLARASLGRDGTLFALGGGVVGDLAGFAAASYMRGIRLVMLPTTLLASVDSSVGGKVGVDLPEGKNLVGAFHQPALVVADTDFLASLPPREVSNGLAEVVKMGLLAGGDFFRDLALIPEARAGEPEALIALTGHSVRYKASVVAADEREGGLRAVLNYGHTLGHALEAASGYGLAHGEAVAVGMCFAARLSERRFGAELLTLHRELLQKAGLPVEVPELGEEGLRDVLGALGRDKKRRAADGAGEHRFILLRAVGEPEWGVPVSEREVVEVLEGA
ncbi:aroB: 3-dehydroquinate synthase [Rubrobacter radiotolerans]|uniref:3-dehydroquinate synthase n=1 Tax=Rubrobacter radiotolerans TaxID=42256 RepID=A0A023X3W9_RUBRA|nr:3-dehydroquinate synthase [Rubrobacter radiotolerans]AHY46749.1 aroB: 3-dehydroquinate synthase [Rubrobacter radiotolerans]MDX5894156.1 3-dehydroquinate synthase [Rubrobacter radiotolerans]SMC05324.1 3-dehydroquinate synthase [Rubrobacter radiotolerans DSM 5868]